jgi:hypothetical protein
LGRSLVVVALAGMVLGSTAAVGKVELPPNVTTRPIGGGNNVIDHIDYSFAATKPLDFAHAKLCIAENVTNPEIQLGDHAGSFVSGHSYYQTSHSATAQGGDIFKYVDDGSRTLIAQGSISRQAGLGGMIGVAIRFELELAINDQAVSMKMLHIEAAQKNTGSMANDGFGPIGVWTGSMYKGDIQALDQFVGTIRSCLES